MKGVTPDHPSAPPLQAASSAACGGWRRCSDRCAPQPRPSATRSWRTSLQRVGRACASACACVHRLVVLADAPLQRGGPVRGDWGPWPPSTPIFIYTKWMNNIYNIAYIIFLYCNNTNNTVYLTAYFNFVRSFVFFLYLNKRLSEWCT